MAQRYQDESLQIAMLAADGGVVRDCEFVDCDVRGPAVLILDRATVADCSWDGSLDAICWTIEPQRAQVRGATVVEGCTFHGCRFHNVGVAAPAAQIAQIRAGFGA